MQTFLHTGQTPGTFLEGLQAFLNKKRSKGISEYSIIHLYNSLWPLAESLGNPPLTAVTARHLKSYNDALWLKYAPGTIRPIIGDIKQFFRWCKKKKLIERDPSKSLKKPRPRRTKDKAAPETAVCAVILHLTKKLERVVWRDLFGLLHCEAAETWTEAERLALRDLFILVFLYETGGRVGELTTLGTATMRRACEAVGGVYVVTGNGKTDDRDLRFTEVSAELWRLWYQVRPDGCKDYAVFSLRPTHPPAALSSNGISQILARRCNEAGTAVFRSHALRHAKVRRSRKLVGLEMASLLIDHSSVEMTRNYAGIEDDEVSEAVRLTGVRFDLWGKPTP